jgi:hypothetical protein
MKERTRGRRGVVVALLAASSFASIGAAQYSTDFESLNGSASGVLLTGQDGYYIPAVGGIDFLVYTYAGNVLGLPSNPAGGNQFTAGNTGANFARAQRNVTYGAGTGVWTAAVDVCASFNGTLPAADNLGSFSLQPAVAGTKYFTALARWVNTATATNWNADYVYFDAAGIQVTASVHNPGFQNLSVNHWFRWETKFDFDTNRILEVRLTDLTTSSTVVHSPADWFMDGGAAGTGNQAPTAFRFFSGGGGAPVIPGNVMAFDNLNIVAPPGFDATVTLGPVTTSVSFDITSGPPGGLGLVFGALMTGPPLLTPFSPEPIWLNVASLFLLAPIPLSPSGSGSLNLSYPTSIGSFVLYEQPFILPTIDIGNAVAVGHSFGSSAYLRYNFRTGGWGSGLEGYAVGTAVAVERVAVGGGVTVLSSTTVPAGGLLTFSGSTTPPLASGEAIRLRIGGLVKVNVSV